MVQTVIYAKEGSFHGRLAILTIRAHLCGFYSLGVDCADMGSQIDPQTGHRVCSECQRITVASGLRICDICDKEYIDKSQYQNPRYDTNCPRCVITYGL